MHDAAFQEYVKIVERLRKECPWDREQTPASLRPSLLEEAYETVEAINHEDWNELKKELGDLLLHVVLQSVIAEESSRFSLQQVIADSSEKLIRRHPHVFGDAKVDNAAHVKANWEKLKMKEGRRSVLDGVPKELPSLLRAYRLQEKASKVGFDWKDRADVWKKVDEEIRELNEAVRNGDEGKVEEELGDLLFAITNYGRFLPSNPELALQRANEKFIKRFQFIERELQKEEKLPEHVSMEELDALWNKSKSAS